MNQEWTPVTQALHQCRFTKDYAVSDDQFFFALNNQKIEQNTHSVSLNLLKILWTHSRHFLSISITYAWYAKLGLSVTCVRHGQTNTYNPLIKWIQFFVAAVTNNNRNNKCTYFENQITSTLKWYFFIGN